MLSKFDAIKMDMKAIITTIRPIHGYMTNKAQDRRFPKIIYRAKETQRTAEKTKANRVLRKELFMQRWKTKFKSHR